MCVHWCVRACVHVCNHAHISVFHARVQVYVYIHVSKCTNSSGIIYPYICKRTHTHTHTLVRAQTQIPTHTGISAICINTQIMKHTHTKNRHTHVQTKSPQQGTARELLIMFEEKNAYSLNVQRAHSALPKVGLVAKKNTRLNTKRIQST